MWPFPAKIPLPVPIRIPMSEQQTIIVAKLRDAYYKLPPNQDSEAAFTLWNYIRKEFGEWVGTQEINIVDKARYVLVRTPPVKS